MQEELNRLGWEGALKAKAVFVGHHEPPVQVAMVTFGGSVGRALDKARAVVPGSAEACR